MNPYGNNLEHNKPFEQPDAERKDILSTSAQEYELMLASIQAYRELENSGAPASERAALNVALKAAYDNVGEPGYLNTLASLHSVIAHIEQDHSVAPNKKEKERRERLHRQDFAKEAQEAIEKDTHAAARRAALYRKLDADAKRRVAVLSQSVELNDPEAVMEFARAIAESTVGEVESEAQKAHIELTVERTANILRQDPAALEVHNAADAQARLDAATIYETRMRAIKEELARDDLSPERRVLLEKALDMGTASALAVHADSLFDENLTKAPENEVIIAAREVQIKQMCDSAHRVFSQLSQREQDLLGNNPDQVMQVLSRSDNINRLMQDGLHRKKDVFNAAVMLAKGEGDGVLSYEVQRDAAYINYKSLLISTNIVENLAGNAIALDSRYKQAFEAKDFTLMRAALRDSSKNLHNVPDDRLDVIIKSTFDKVSAYEKSSGESIAFADSARVTAVAQGAAADAVETVRNEIKHSAEKIRATGGDLQSYEKRNDRRHEEGVSFLELEYEDVVGMINKHDPKLAKRLGGADGLTAAEAVAVLEKYGVISPWTETENNRQDSGPLYAMAAQAKTGEQVGIEVDNAWTRFGKWNDENLARLDVDRSQGNANQLGGQEAWDALRLADFVKQNNGVMRAITNNQAGVTYQKGHDVNQDGKLDEMEIARVLMNKGVSDATQVDSFAELNLALDEVSVAQEMNKGRAKGRG